MLASAHGYRPHSGIMQGDSCPRDSAPTQQFLVTIAGGDSVSVCLPLIWGMSQSAISFRTDNEPELEQLGKVPQVT